MTTINWPNLNGRFGLQFQPVNAKHWPKRSAGVLKFNVSLGLSLSLLATAFSQKQTFREENRPEVKCPREALHETHD